MEHREEAVQRVEAFLQEGRPWGSAYDVTIQFDGEHILSTADLRTVLDELAQYRAAADAVRKMGLSAGDDTSLFARGWNACRARVHGLIAHHLADEEN